MLDGRQGDLPLGRHHTTSVEQHITWTQEETPKTDSIASLLYFFVVFVTNTSVLVIVYQVLF